jgi:hypothetical protein
MFRLTCAVGLCALVALFSDALQPRTLFVGPALGASPSAVRASAPVAFDPLEVPIGFETLWMAPQPVQNTALYFYLGASFWVFAGIAVGVFFATQWAALEWAVLLARGGTGQNPVRPEMTTTASDAAGTAFDPVWRVFSRPSLDPNDVCYVDGDGYMCANQGDLKTKCQWECNDTECTESCLVVA